MGNNGRHGSSEDDNNKSGCEIVETSEGACSSRLFDSMEASLIIHSERISARLDLWPPEIPSVLFRVTTIITNRLFCFGRTRVEVVYGLENVSVSPWTGIPPRA